MSRRLSVAALLILTMPVYAVETFKFSNYGSGTQIWFEVEHFDERNPDTDQYFPVVDEAGAFGQAITRSGGAGGRISWTFNISGAGGRGGTWYFWARQINPSNQSDYMLVEADPDDPQIPTGPSFPGGDGTAPFDNGDDRIFEENVGPPWGWARSGHQEGHTKELQDGENTMHIFHRQGNDTVFWDVFMWTDDSSYVPTDADYENAIPGGGIGTATRPEPEDGAMLTDTWVSLNWRPGDFAVSHDVYFGENFDDVNAGTADTFRGNQASDFFVVGFPGMPYPEGLVPGTAYYWRVDEVNDADPNSPWRGDVWSIWIPPITAYAPDPTDGAKFIASDTALSWAPGLGAKLHTIFFGGNSDDVANAVVGLPQGDTTFDPGALDLGKSYYWRVDEFDGFATHKGDVWSFETLPDIPITDPSLIGWWKLDEGLGNTAVDWSGHDNHGSLNGTDMSWMPDDGMIGGALSFNGTQSSTDYVEISTTDISLTAGTVAMWAKLPPDPQSPATRYFFGHTTIPAFSDRIQLYMDNSDNLLDLGLGDSHARDTDIMSLTTDTWYHVALTWDGGNYVVYVNGEEKANGSYTALDALNTVADIGNDGDTDGRTEAFNGLLDNVRIYDHALSQAEIPLAMRGDPLAAWDPNPRPGSTVYITDATPLSWSKGDRASKHDVYLGTDRDAVADADASDTTGVYRGNQNATTYAPAEGIEWGGGPYYWRIDQINADGTITKGVVWSFTISDFTLVEDFESYTDNDADNEAIWQHWIDGFGAPTNGSQAGNLMPPYAEQTIVHGDRQSMPLFYFNTGGVTNSEAVLTLAAPRDWTQHGVGELSIWFQGRAPSVGSFTEGPVGTFTMTASGTDIWNQADEFHFAYKTLTGAGEIVAKVEGVDRTDAWAKAGVMIRETLDPGSKFAMVVMTPTNADGTPTQGCRFQARTDTDGSATSDTSVVTPEQTALTTPYWVKLERDFAGNCRGYYSSDGTAWTLMVWRPLVSMESTVLVGLAVTSHNAALTCQAKFSNVTITGTVTGQWQSQDIGIASNAAEPLYVSLSNASGAPAVVAHPGPDAANTTTWAEWVVPLEAFADKGINLANVEKIAIGLGSTGGAASGGLGVIYIDDIRLYRPRNP